MEFDEHREYDEPLEHEKEHQVLKIGALAILTIVGGVAVFYGAWFLLPLL